MFAWSELEFDTRELALIAAVKTLSDNMETSERQFYFDDEGNTYVNTYNGGKYEISKMSIRLIGQEIERDLDDNTINNVEVAYES
jgi:hypothetical protein